MKLRTLLIGFLWALAPTMGLAQPNLPVQPVVPLRGDMGVLKDFRPNAAVWLSEDRLLLADLRYNNFQIFDPQGRRFRLFEASSLDAPAQYVGLAALENNEYLALGSHYHEKNHPRYRDQRSIITRFSLEGETLLEEKGNLSPHEALRRTRMWGSSPTRQLEFCGLALDKANDRAWFGLTQPVSANGTLSLLSCSLQKLLAQDPELSFTEVDTGFQLPEDGPCGLPTYLADIATLDDGSLLFLLTADDIEGKRFCSNSIWHWSPNGGPATMVRENLALQNRAKGMAVRSLGNDQYQVALVCDNDTVSTGIPASLLVLDEPISLSDQPRPTVVSP